jgi:glycosyltransferase involved in cell wall biosynthesis
LKTSVIIPYRDRPEALSRTLQSIRSYWLGEILIVDDGSKLNVGYEIAKYFAAFYIRMPGAPGPFRLAAARNLGAAMALGNLLLFNDVDIVHEGPAIDGMEECFSMSYPDRIVLPELHFFEGGQVKTSRDRIYRHRLVDGGTVESTEWLLGWMGWAAVPRMIFNSVGGFDQRYRGWSYEDMDFCYRAARQGFRFFCTKKALGVHWPHEPQPEKELTAREGERIFEEKHGFPIPCEVIDLDGEIVEFRRSP